jgi:hypothetical protein
MVETRIQAGSVIDIPSTREISDLVSAQMREMYRGVKWLRLPQMGATASGSTLTINPQMTGVYCGPEQGYVWSIRRVVVDGMTSGATPDIVNMYRNAHTGQPPLWQFNGNNFGYTFGRLEMVLMSGDFLEFSSEGIQSFAATGLIRVSGEVLEVPAEMLAKLVG